MNTADEMGLTPEAARAYESYFLPAIFSQWPPIMAGIADVTNGKDVLDVGCGTGVFTREALNIVGAAGTVTGADLSESMLSVAREICPTGRFERCDVINLPFADASFDAVVASFILMFVSEPARGVSEMIRVLRPGGRMALSVWEALAENVVYSRLVEIVSEVVDKQAGELIAWPFALGSEGKLAQVFDQSGVTVTSIAVHAGRAKFPSIASFVRTEIGAWLLADAVDESMMTAIISRAEDAFGEFQNSSGTMDFPFNATIAMYAKPA